MTQQKYYKKKNKDYSNKFKTMKTNIYNYKINMHKQTNIINI